MITKIRDYFEALKVSRKLSPEAKALLLAMEACVPYNFDINSPAVQELLDEGLIEIKEN